MLTRISRLAALLALLAPGTHHAQEQRRPDENRLEDARKDLRELPLLEDPGATRTALPNMGVSVPSLSLQRNPSPSRNSQSTPRAEPSSQGWLLDALQQRESSRNGTAFRRGGDASRDTVDPRDPTRAKTQPTNPMDGYLRNWLTPQDRELLLPRAKAERSGPVQSPQETVRHEIFDTRPKTISPRPRFGAAEKNPYLQESTTFAPSPVVSPRVPPQSTAPTPGGLETAIPLSSPAPPRMERKPEEPALAPTAPLVDEQRYFPQLRKF